MASFGFKNAVSSFGRLAGVCVRRTCFPSFRSHAPETAIAAFPTCYPPAAQCFLQEFPGGATIAGCGGVFRNAAPFLWPEFLSEFASRLFSEFIQLPNHALQIDDGNTHRIRSGVSAPDTGWCSLPHLSLSFALAAASDNFFSLANLAI